jgi:hypothetical protein
MTKPDIALVESALLESGWNKNSSTLYKYMDKAKKYIVSIEFRKTKSKTSVGVIASFMLHNVDLNELSCFLWDYYKRDASDNELFAGGKLPISRHLHGVCACNLFETAQTTVLNDPSSSVVANECTSISSRIYEEYGSIDRLISSHASPNKYNGTAMILYLFKKEYGKVLDMLKSDETFPPTGAGDVKLGLWAYLDRNKLCG